MLVTNPKPLAGILESTLYAEDLTQAEDFYSRVLELEFHSKEGDRHLFFRCGATMLLIFNPQLTSRHGPVPAHGASGPGHLAFAIENESDLTDWRSRLEEHGVAIEAETDWPGGGRSIYFRDPAGNSLELATPRIWDL
jgi:catechol 2,3-dioxygenase-like lactoylglutathione lyase family enzyme